MYKVKVGCSHLYSPTSWLIINNESLIIVTDYTPNFISLSKLYIKALYLA